MNRKQSNWEVVAIIVFLVFIWVAFSSTNDKSYGGAKDGYEEFNR